MNCNPMRDLNTETARRWINICGRVGGGHVVSGTGETETWCRKSTNGLICLKAYRTPKTLHRVCEQPWTKFGKSMQRFIGFTLARMYTCIQMIANTLPDLVALVKKMSLHLANDFLLNNPVFWGSFFHEVACTQSCLSTICMHVVKLKGLFLQFKPFSKLVHLKISHEL